MCITLHLDPTAMLLAWNVVDVFGMEMHTRAVIDLSMSKHRNSRILYMGQST